MTDVRSKLLLALLPATLLLAAAGCAPAPAGQADTITIGAYSVVREAFHDGLLPAFAAHWKAKTSREVRFVESYNASGAQARAIRAGLDADLAVLSHEDDMDVLAKAGLICASWKDGPNKGVLTHSLVVIGYRDGNPRGIKDWADLAKPGVGVLYPDPKTSGGARWNINAIFGAALLAPGGGKQDPDGAWRFLASVQANVVNMDASGRQSVANFERGTGDALVTYENEILLRLKEGREIPYVIPPATLLIEGPAAIVDANVDKHGNRAVAEALLAFLTSPEGQRILSEYGFRPIDPKLPDATGRPLPPRLFTMKDLGGWEGVRDALYGPKGAWTTSFADLRRGKAR
ncbi:MAG TPA: sulfate ABC transporter substrate-binding protein [Isosphaeraceae bacterium]|jgi:sulfate transport system substrate-binding protein|nr:sulfate ABC transporter substrate-binding protein [Isosphaeraceae bacterium]